MSKILTDKKEIEAFLKHNSIRNYEIVQSNDKYCYMVNVYGHVYLAGQNLKTLGVKFNEVKGDFNCSMNDLKSLRGAPNIVDSFYCNNNKLENLKYAPTTVHGNFDCSSNEITSLKGAPRLIRVDFNCRQNKLKSISHGPHTVYGFMDFTENDLQAINLKDLPQEFLAIYLLMNKSLGAIQNVHAPQELKILLEQQQLSQHIKSIVMKKVSKL